MWLALLMVVSSIFTVLMLNAGLYTVTDNIEGLQKQADSFSPGPVLPFLQPANWFVVFQSRVNHRPAPWKHPVWPLPRTDHSSLARCWERFVSASAAECHRRDGTAWCAGERLSTSPSSTRTGQTTREVVCQSAAECERERLFHRQN